MTVLKLKSIGESTGVVIPQEMLDRLKVEEGDSLLALETRHGYLIVQNDPEVERQFKLGQEVMAEYRDTLRALAK